VESTTDGLGVALQRRQPRIGVACFQPRDCRLRRLHARGDLGLRKAQQEASLDELLYEIMALVPEGIEPRKLRPSRSHIEDDISKTR
jgi:hypothetical protein